MNTKYLNLLFAVCLVGAASCNKDPELSSKQIDITFNATPDATKATGSTFETSDQISVFATCGDDNLKASNYADNVKYIYSGNKFVASGNGIKYPDETGLYFKAVYPYSNNASLKFNFDVKTNQGDYDSLTASDLMIASTDMCTEESPQLSFKHKMAWVIIQPIFADNTTEFSVEMVNVSYRAEVDLNKEKVSALSSYSSTIKGYPYNEYYFFYVPPQTIPANQEWIQIKFGSTTVSCMSSQTVKLSSGRSAYFTVDLTSVSTKSTNRQYYLKEN